MKSYIKRVDAAIRNHGPIVTAVPPGLVVYADGCCEPNPGPGGWGFVVYRDGQEIHAESGGQPDTTNNAMELTGALKALEWLAAGGFAEPVRLFSDSKYTVDGCNDWRHGWKAKGWQRGGAKAKPENRLLANAGLWQALDAALTAVPIKLQWCKAHVGIIGNERADELSLIGCASLSAVAYLKRIGYLDREPDLGPLISCGFLEIPQADASAVQAHASTLQADARPETEQIQIREEKSSEPNGSGAEAPASLAAYGRADR